MKAISPETRSVLKNMIIAILTSVAGATIIYFLGFNNKKPPLSPLEREEITVDSWKTYIAVENIYIQNSVSMMQDAFQFRAFEDINKESEGELQKFQNSLEDLITTEGVDIMLVAYLKKRRDVVKELKLATGNFYSGMAAVKQDWTTHPLRDTLKARFTGFSQKARMRLTQSVPDIEKLSKKLSEKYEQPFNINELLVIQSAKFKKEIFFVSDAAQENNNLPPDQSVSGGTNAGNLITSEPAKASKQYLTGKWNAEGGAVITLMKNGKLSWLIPPENHEAKGSWALKNGQLVMNINRHPLTGKSAKWVFNLSNVFSETLTIILDATPPKMYNLVRQ